MVVAILTEKPSAARNFAKALTGSQDRMQGTFNGENIVIVHARGHLFEFVKPNDMVDDTLKDKYGSWDIANLPWDHKDLKWKNEPKYDTQSLISKLKSVLSKVDEIAIGTDVDPTGEGQLIAWNIINELGLYGKKKLSRMYFLDESVTSVQKAFKDRAEIKDMYTDKEYRMADFRTKFDYLTMQFTRIASNYTPGDIIRQGRLKSAMVRLVGDQIKRHDEWEKVLFYENRFRDENGVMYTDPNAEQYKQKADVPGGLRASAVVEKSKTRKKQAPPKLLDLAGLSSILSSKGLKAEVVLGTYQQMYEAQIVSYPRTEDKFVSPEQFKELLPHIDNIARLVGIDPAKLTVRKPRASHVKTGGAHGANRPGTNVPKSLKELSQYGPGAQEIYELLAKNYLTMLAEDYVYDLVVGYPKDYPTYIGSVQIPVSMGYRDVFYDKDEEEEENIYNGVGLGTMAEPFIHEGFPRRPNWPTQKWLMKQLEMRDVGTGATRTSIYADVTAKKTALNKYPLMSETKGRINMTEYGAKGYNLLPGTNIGSLDISENLLKNMKQVADGTLDPDKALSEVAKWVTEDRDTMAVNAEKAGMQGVVPKVDGVWNGKEISIKPSWGGYEFSEKELEKLFAGEHITIKVKNKDGKMYDVVGHLAEQTYKGATYVGFEWDKEYQKASDPSRAHGMFKGKRVNFNRTFSGHRFTDEEVEKLLAGEEISFDVTWRNGNTGVATGKLGTGDYGFGFQLDTSGWGKKGGFKNDAGIPFMFSGHKFTDKELKDLEAGKTISLTGLTKKSGGTWSARVRFGEKSDGTMGIIPHFDKDF